jgi:hypothetical protein
MGRSFIGKPVVCRYDAIQSCAWILGRACADTVGFVSWRAAMVIMAVHDARRRAINTWGED